MTTMAAIGSVFTKVQDTVKTKSGSAVNIVICLVTVGSEQLFSFAAFQCPCPSGNGTTGSFQENFLYGWVFIIVPALALFCLGYGMNLKTWKLLTGCLYRSSRASRGCVACFSTLFEIFLQSLVAPMAWMSVAFLDGKYYACASTVVPDKNSCEDEATKKMFTQTFDENKRKSQIIGWCLIAAALFLGSAFFMLHRCLSPLTYHHRKYARWYREMESAAFEKKAKDQIRNEVEKETVERFLQEKRDKDDWDKISTVFNFTRDERNYALYSRLDEWNEMHKIEYPLPSETDVANEATEDDSSIEEPNLTKNNNINASATAPKAESTAAAAPVSFAETSETGENTSMEQAKQPLIPKICPPPINKNAKTRHSSSGFEDGPSMTTSQTTAFTTSQPDSTMTSTRDHAPQHPPAGTKSMASQQQQQSTNMTSHLMGSFLHDNGETMQDDVINMKNLSLSMPNIPADTKGSPQNGKVHIKHSKTSNSPFYGDDEDVIIS